MKKAIILLFLTMSFIVITGCEKKVSVTGKRLKEGSFIVIDVRTNEEYLTGHVIDAINIPYDEINENTGLPKDKTILVYCKSGARSKIAYEKLKELGYDVMDLGAYDNVNLEKERSNYK